MSKRSAGYLMKILQVSVPMKKKREISKGERENKENISHSFNFTRKAIAVSRWWCHWF